MDNHIHQCWCSSPYPGCDAIMHGQPGRMCDVCKRPMKNSTELQDDVYLKACNESLSEKILQRPPRPLFNLMGTHFEACGFCGSNREVDSTAGIRGTAMHSHNIKGKETLFYLHTFDRWEDCEFFLKNIKRRIDHD